MIIDNIIEICVAIDIAILGIAYPIIIDKYLILEINIFRNTFLFCSTMNFRKKV